MLRLEKWFLGLSPLRQFLAGVFTAILLLVVLFIGGAVLVS